MTTNIITIDCDLDSEDIPKTFVGHPLYKRRTVEELILMREKKCSEKAQVLHDLARIRERRFHLTHEKITILYDELLNNNEEYSVAYIRFAQLSLDISDIEMALHNEATIFAPNCSIVEQDYSGIYDQKKNESENSQEVFGFNDV